MIFRFHSLSALTAAALTMNSAVAGPVDTSYVNVFADVNFPGQTSVHQNVSGTTAQSIELDRSGPGWLGSATAYAAPGVLKNYAGQSSFTFQGWAGTQTGGRWEQLVSFVNPELTGQRGFATLKYYVEVHVGTGESGAGVDATADALFSSVVGFGNGRLGSAMSNGYIAAGVMQTGTLNADGRRWDTTYGYGNNVRDIEGFWSSGNQPEAVPQGYLYLPVEFIWGETYNLFAYQSAECSSWNTPNSTVSCLVDAAHSAYWGGIGEIIDSDGNLISGGKLMTADGRDFSNSMVPGSTPPVGEVPEPGSIGLMVAGLAMAGLARRRMRA